MVANGAVLATNATFVIRDRNLNNPLPPGTVFTALSNTSVNPIGGTFANLPDGAVLTVGANTYKANYKGGDGNDLTLTVIPDLPLRETLRRLSRPSSQITGAKISAGTLSRPS